MGSASLRRATGLVEAVSYGCDVLGHSELSSEGVRSEGLELMGLGCDLLGHSEEYEELGSRVGWQSQAQAQSLVRDLRSTSPVAIHKWLKHDACDLREFLPVEAAPIGKPGVQYVEPVHACSGDAERSVGTTRGTFVFGEQQFLASLNLSQRREIFFGESLGKPIGIVEMRGAHDFGSGDMASAINGSFAVLCHAFDPVCIQLVKVPNSDGPNGAQQKALKILAVRSRFVGKEEAEKLLDDQKAQREPLVLVAFGLNGTHHAQVISVEGANLGPQGIALFLQIGKLTSGHVLGTDELRIHEDAAPYAAKHWKRYPAVFSRDFTRGLIKLCRAEIGRLEPRRGAHYEFIESCSHVGRGLSVLVCIRFDVLLGGSHSKSALGHFRLELQRSLAELLYSSVVPPKRTCSLQDAKFESQLLKLRCGHGESREYSDCLPTGAIYGLRSGARRFRSSLWALRPLVVRTGGGHHGRAGCCCRPTSGSCGQLLLTAGLRPPSSRTSGTPTRQAAGAACPATASLVSAASLEPSACQYGVVTVAIENSPGFRCRGRPVTRVADSTSVNCESVTCCCAAPCHSVVLSGKETEADSDFESGPEPTARQCAAVPRKTQVGDIDRAGVGEGEPALGVSLKTVALQGVEGVARHGQLGVPERFGRLRTHRNTLLLGSAQPTRRAVVSWRLDVRSRLLSSSESVRRIRRTQVTCPDARSYMPRIPGGNRHRRAGITVLRAPGGQR